MSRQGQDRRHLLKRVPHNALFPLPYEENEKLMKTRLLIVLPVVIVLGACSYTSPRYSINADTNVALKSLGATNVGVGPFAGPSSFSKTCRGLRPLEPPDGQTHTEYLRKALEDELKVAGAYGASNPRIVLSGTVNKLEFSSIRGLTGGSWDIDLTLRSSNGRRLTAAEHYEFDSGLTADTACRQTADAYMHTVQNLIKKIVQMPDFKAMVQ